ncbi:hypothetical protein [Diaphorobacter aerolatus]|uniref:hypothetical protein n=1 Tax=Diaphorobacter aerolatus TaxID=1288495 RepID=UPI001D00D36D|nr:hypothetical protein [Diaphorobacter aerolatus]
MTHARTSDDRTRLVEYAVQTEWVHLQLNETNAYKDVYGFVGTLGTVNLEGIRYTPVGRPSKTLLVFMHPATTLQLLPMPRELARQDAHVLCAGSRYQRNDSALIMESVVLDLGPISAMRVRSGTTKRS